MTYKSFLFALVCAFVPSLTMAQSSEASSASEDGALKSYNFIELQGGAQLTSTDYKMDKLVTPAFGFSVGRFFTPAVGARLHVSGWEAKSGFSRTVINNNWEGNYSYKWKYITTDFDVMVNLTNLFSKNKNHFLNFMLIGGIGLNTAWDKDEANALADNNSHLNILYKQDGTRLSHNLRAGMRVETNVAKPFGVSLEVMANSLDDRFNAKINNSDDWMFTAMVGVSFRFGTKKTAPISVNTALADMDYLDQRDTKQEVAVPVVPVEKKEEKKVEKKVEKLNETKFFDIRDSKVDASNEVIKKTADFMKRNPEATVYVTGYADKGTGTEKVNMKYSKERAEAVKEVLVDDFKIDVKRVVVDAKVDTIQHNTEMYKILCVIIVGESYPK